MSERDEEAGNVSERVDALTQQLAEREEQHEAEVAEMRERMEDLAQEAKARADEARRAERSAAETVRQKESAHAEQMKQVGGGDSPSPLRVHAQTPSRAAYGGALRPRATSGNCRTATRSLPP